MSYNQQTAREFLAGVTPFSELAEGELDALCQQMQFLRYRAGQPICVQDRLPQQVVVLYRGTARLLALDPQTDVPELLKLLGPGSILGAASLVRQVPCETALASGEAIGLTLEADAFREAIAQSPQLAEFFYYHCPLAEAFDLLRRDLRRQGRGATNLKTVAQAACANASVFYLTSDAAQSPPADGQRIWYYSGGGQPDSFKPGMPLDASGDWTSAQLPSDRPARFVGFRSQYLTWVYEDTGGADPAASELPYAEPPSRNGGQAAASSAQTASSQAEDGGQTAQTSSDPKRRQRYPHVHNQGKRDLDKAMACFRMLSQYFGTPFKRDTIQRSLTERAGEDGTVSLPLAGAVTELLGLRPQLFKVQVKHITRLQPPALVRWQDGLAVLYEANNQRLVLGVPERGILKLTPDEFAQQWGEGGQILQVEATAETPQQRFGLSWFWPYIKQYRGTLALVFVASFFVQLFALANPLMIQVIINKVIIQNSPDTLQVLGVFLLVVAIFEAVLSTLRTYIFTDTTNRIDMSLGARIIDRLLRLPLRYFERRPVGEISSRVNELEQIRQFLTGTALTVVLDAIFSVLYIAILLVYSWQLTLATLATIPVFVLATLFFSPLIRRQLRTKAERNAETQSYLVESLSGIQTVKAQNIELRTRWNWQQRYARYVAAGFRTVVTQTLSSSTSNFLNKLSGLIAIWFGAYLVLQGQLNLGQLIAFRIIAGYVTGPILRLSQLWQNFQETALSLERLGDIVDHPEEGEQDRGNIPMPAIQGGIQYERVSFRFNPKNPVWQLNDVSLRIPPATFVGVAGKSGAGKSTLAKLLARLYPPEQGRILIDGYDISKVDLYSLRRQIGVVPQETLLFEGTVQENIALTRPDAATDEIVEAAQVACAHEFIMNLSAGYESSVGERGGNLSGGQQQRIAIARTILQQPRLLVLDEATSALDYPTERQLCANVTQAFRDRTVLFITHRLGSIQNADLILMMEGGQVVEQGTHAQLMDQQGSYYQLYQQQASQEEAAAPQA